LGPIEALWATLLFVFALIGIVRGFLKELGVTTVLVVLLFALSRYGDFVEALIKLALAKAAAQGLTVMEEHHPLIIAGVYIFIIVATTFISYHGETLAFSGKPPKGITGVLLGLFTGLINGYLVAGSVWYYLHKYDYPIRVWGLFRDGLTPFAERLLPLLPLNLLKPFLPFLVIAMVVLRVIR